ncbi:hypothetical protein PVK06_003121 [Gossypium arboreum]|uniref:BTB domain-containing protein n=1 Tax=Gossypium arboreum TaxID=29729 RepID=A0ABR0R5I5_GOSAR|nr:hypothetical protein PVK06_003121 [Gossypium arboreum]
MFCGLIADCSIYLSKLIVANENILEKKHDFYSTKQNEDFAALEQVVTFYILGVPLCLAEFSDGMEEDDNNIVVTDIEPKVFKALLHFIYRDNLIDDEEFVGTSSSSMPSVSDALAAKL